MRSSLCEASSALATRAADRPHAPLAVGYAPVSAHVAILAAGTHVDGILVADVARLAQGGGVDAREGALGQALDGAVAELHLDRAAVNEVELLLGLVRMKSGLIADGHDDRVDPECGHVQALADLAKSVAIAE